MVINSRSCELMKSFSLDGQKAPVRSWWDHHFVMLTGICSVPGEQTQHRYPQPALSNLHRSVELGRKGKGELLWGETFSLVMAYWVTNRWTESPFWEGILSFIPFCYIHFFTRKRLYGKAHGAGWFCHLYATSCTGFLQPRSSFGVFQEWSDLRKQNSLQRGHW